MSNNEKSELTFSIMNLINERDQVNSSCNAHRLLIKQINTLLATKNSEEVSSYSQVLINRLNLEVSLFAKRLKTIEIEIVKTLENKESENDNQN